LIIDRIIDRRSVFAAHQIATIDLTSNKCIGDVSEGVPVMPRAEHQARG
jgi:hypothetical protein